MNCDPNALMAAAKCYSCIPHGLLPQVRTYLLCRLAQTGLVCQSNFLLEPPAPVTRTNYTGVVGYEFKVSIPVYVTKLGRYYEASNNQDHLVRLWDTNGAILMTGGTVLAASASDAIGFKWVDVAPVTLDPAKTYRIACDETINLDAWKDFWNPTGYLDPRFTNLRMVYFAPTHGAYPSNPQTAGQVYDCIGICFVPTTACILPGVMTIGAGSVPGAVYITPNPSAPYPTVGFIVRWGTTAGGPYPNSMSFPYPGPIMPAVPIAIGNGLVPGVTYYFVAFADNGEGCLSGASNEVSGAAIPNIPSGGFYYTPNTTSIEWTDTNGTFNGDLAFFNANADKATVTTVFMDNRGITAVGNLPDLPALAYLDCQSNPDLTSLDLSGMTTLTDVLANDCTALASVVLTGTVFPAGTNTLNFNNCALTVGDATHGVDGVLARSVAAGFTDASISLDGGTNALPTDCIAVNALVALGNTVDTNRVCP